MSAGARLLGRILLFGDEKSLAWQCALSWALILPERRSGGEGGRGFGEGRHDFVGKEVEGAHDLHMRQTAKGEEADEGFQVEGLGLL